MNLTEARSTVVNGALHVAENDGQYGPAEIDRAIRFVGNDFVTATHCTTGVVAVTLESGSHVIDLTTHTGLENFVIPNFLSADIDGEFVDRVPAWTAKRYFQQSKTPAGQPVFVGFDSPKRVWLYPEPDAQYTLHIQWWAPFTAWTAGTDESDAVELNIPAQHIDGVLRFGAATAMVYADPNSLYTQTGWQQYQMLRDRAAAMYDVEATAEALDEPKTYATKPRTG